MKKTLLSLAVLATLFTACKKDQASSTNDQKTVSPADPKALTDAITVFHASKITAASPIPSTNGNAPALSASSDNQQINALNGRYVVIKPAIASGVVAGFYLKITGADFYYKIDFSKPRAQANRLVGPMPVRRSHFLTAATRVHAGNRIDSTGTGYSDSSIIIQLPDNIAPGTFCCEYWMYDSLNQVSNPIKVCVNVAQLGGGADGNGFTGVWKQNRYKYSSDFPDTSWHTITYQKDYYDKQPYLCEDNKLQYSYDSTSTDPNLVKVWAQYYWTVQSDFTFALNGGAKYKSGFEEGYIDLDSSSCSNIVYRSEGAPVHEDTGGWSFNSSSEKLIFVFDFDGAGNEDPQAYQYTVTLRTADKLVLHDEQYNDWYEFTRK